MLRANLPISDKANCRRWRRKRRCRALYPRTNHCANSSTNREPNMGANYYANHCANPPTCKLHHPYGRPRPDMLQRL